MNITTELINHRVSLRKYQNLPISKEHEAIILESAMRAPTAGNMMLYSIIVVKDRAKREQLSKSCDNQPFIANSPMSLIFVADYHKLYQYYINSEVKEYCQNRGEEFIGPTYANLMLGCSDALIAAQNAAIAAESLGIGSCYIGDIMENYELHKELFKLPDFVFPIAMLTMGYYPPEISREPKSRFKKDYVVFQEEYQSLSPEQILDMHSEWNKKFSENNRYGAKNFGQFHYSMKTKADFSLEMERSVKEYLKFWEGRKL